MRVVLPLLCISLVACPHDFDRKPRGDANAADAHLDVGATDLGPPAPDGPRADAPVVPDLAPQPDAGCPPPCVESLPPFFKLPGGVTVDSAGIVYVSESAGHRIWSVTAGQATLLAGGAEGFVNGTAAQAQFDIPMGLAVDNGTIYVADHYNSVIRAVANKVVSTLAGHDDGIGGYIDGPAAQARFYGLTDVAVDAQGWVYVADKDNHVVRLVESGQVKTLAGDGYVGFKDGLAGSARFARPAGVAVDSAGTVYVADRSNHAIRLIDGGVVSTLAGTGQSGFLDGPALKAQFSYPLGVAVDGSGVVYVADSYNHRVRMITPAANGFTVSTLAGTGTAGRKDGPASSAELSSPAALAVDSNGTVYVADFANNLVRKIRQK